MEKTWHQYIDRQTGEVRTETLYGDGVINFIYSRVRENAPTLFKALVSARASRVLGYINYDSQVCAALTGSAGFVEKMKIDLSECVENPESLRTLRDVFERKIRYWETRPMPDNPGVIVSPADSRVIVGSFEETSQLFVKNKYFDLNELLGGRAEWLSVFEGGDFAVFRLTPDKYHHNHLPVSGIVKAHYEIDGCYHSCNPRVMITLANANSKNKRVLTIIDTDVEGGTWVGIVAMVEVAALMIGDIVQCYSDNRYEAPREVREGMFLTKGQPKSLYRPGSSTDILLFQKERMVFSEDIIANLSHPFAFSRCSLSLEKPAVETEVKVREEIGRSVAERI